MNNLKVKSAQFLALVLALTVGTVASAAPAGDYDAIIDAVDWGDVVTGIGAIAALIAVVLVAKRGAKMLLGMIGR